MTIVRLRCSLNELQKDASNRPLPQHDQRSSRCNFSNILDDLYLACHVLLFKFTLWEGFGQFAGLRRRVYIAPACLLFGVREP